MGIEYYAFALFVTAMICVIAILFKMLFADVRRQKKLLEEKENALLELYRTVENIMEEFADQVRSVTKEINEHEDKLTKAVNAQASVLSHIKSTEMIKQEAAAILPRRATDDSGLERIKAAGDVIEMAERAIIGDTHKHITALENKPVFKQVLEESAGTPAGSDDKTIAIKHKRNEKILQLSEQGKLVAEIARELSITQNEVKLIIELGKQE